jgi:MFS-type transporter involved in bile tolerance (Atg22 family)
MKKHLRELYCKGPPIFPLLVFFNSGIVASFFIIPIRPEFSWELLLFLYIIIGAVFGAILLFTNELLLKVLKIESSKKSSKMGLLDRMGFLEAFVFILVIIYLRGGVIC